MCRRLVAQNSALSESLIYLDSVEETWRREMMIRNSKDSGVTEQPYVSDDEESQQSCMSPRLPQVIRNATRSVRNHIRRKLGRSSSGNKEAKPLPSKEDLEKMAQSMSEPEYHELPLCEMQPVHEYDYPDFAKLKKLSKKSSPNFSIHGPSKSFRQSSRKLGHRLQTSIKKSFKSKATPRGIAKKETEKEKNETEIIANNSDSDEGYVSIDSKRQIFQRATQNENKRKCSDIDEGYVSMKCRDNPVAGSTMGTSHVKNLAANFEKDVNTKHQYGNISRSTSEMYGKRAPVVPKVKQNASLNLGRNHQHGPRNQQPKPLRPPKPDHLISKSEGVRPSHEQDDFSEHVHTLPKPKRKNIVKPIGTVLPNPPFINQNAIIKPWKPLESGTDTLSYLDKRSFKKQPRFCSMSVEDLVINLNQCGLSEMARICESEGLDGTFLNDMSTKELQDEFHLSSLQTKKIEKIKGGWRPYRKEFKPLA